MNRVFRATAGLLAATSLFAANLHASAQTDRKTGTIFKKQVDGLIRLVRSAAGTGPLGGESVLDTAKILTVEE